jgi:fructose-bisphosphate aldolase class II
MVPQLKKAQAEQYAVPLFLTFEMMGFEGTLAALEENRAPGIIGIYQIMMRRPNIRAFLQYIRARAEDSPVPLSIIIDHGTSLEQCMQILDYGSTDVMFDGGKLPLEENIAITRSVVRDAHAMGAGVEAELGFVGHGSDYADLDLVRQGFTKPEEAVRFIDETGADALAIAFGSAHAQYKGEPQLALDLLADIRARVDVPLVLHGGSGLSDEQFRAAIEGGISKINIFTDLGLTAGREMVSEAQAEEASYFSLIAAAKNAFRERCKHYIDVFGASGKA